MQGVWVGRSLGTRALVRGHHSDPVAGHRVMWWWLIQVRALFCCAELGVWSWLLSLSLKHIDAIPPTPVCVSGAGLHRLSLRAPLPSGFQLEIGEQEETE